jgi:hypothetical protein
MRLLSISIQSVNGVGEVGGKGDPEKIGEEQKGRTPGIRPNEHYEQEDRYADEGGINDRSTQHLP